VITTALGVAAGIVIGFVALKLAALAAIAGAVKIHEWRQPDTLAIVHELDRAGDTVESYWITDEGVVTADELADDSRTSAGDHGE